MELKPGTRLQSTACETQVVVVKTPAGDVDLRCGGTAMVPIGDDAERAELAAEYAAGTALGKRYASADGALELLCTKAGDGSLSIGDQPVAQKDAKPLPSSD